MVAIHPPKSTGLTVGLAALAGLLAVCAGALAGLAAQLGWVLTALSGLGLAVAVPALGWLAYRLAGLLNAHYRLSEGELGVTWGNRRLTLPLAEIEEARLAAEFPGQLEPPAWNWPGCYVGRLHHPDLGAVEFLATTPAKAGLVMLGYADGWLVLSPPDPAAFLKALATGPAALAAAEPAEPAAPAAPPAPARPRLAAVKEWALWQDWTALGLLAGGAAAGLTLAGYLLLVAAQLPPLIALRFDPAGQPLRFGPPSGLFTLVLIGALSWIANAAVGVILHRREAERPAAYLLFGATIVVQVMLWVAAVGLLTAGT